jgi:hypothetical protein
LAKKKPVTFDSNITVKSILSLSFRAFVNEPKSNHPADQMDIMQEIQQPELTAFIVESYAIDETGNFCAGGGIWIAPNSPKNKAVAVPEHLATSNSGELAAILHLIQSSPENMVLNFCLTSKHIVRKLTIDVWSSESAGWTGDKDKTLLTTIIAALRVGGTKSSFCEAGESDSDQNKIQLARQLAITAMNNYPDDYMIDPEDLITVPPRF